MIEKKIVCDNNISIMMNSAPWHQCLCPQRRKNKCLRTTGKNIFRLSKDGLLYMEMPRPTELAIHDRCPHTKNNETITKIVFPTNKRTLYKM